MIAKRTGTRHRTAFTARMVSVVLHAAGIHSLVADLAREDDELDNDSILKAAE
jgi:hypothetical protein